MLKLNKKSSRIAVLFVLISTVITGCKSAPTPMSIAPVIPAEPSQQEVLSNHLTNNEFDAALSVVEQLLKTSPNEESYKIIKAKCLFMVNKTSDTRKETEMYLENLSKELDKSSAQWRENEIMRVRNLFYIRTPQSARRAQQVFGKNIATIYGDDLSAHELFWGGLVSNVCLDEVKGQAYWSKLSQTYIETQKKQLKQYK